MMRKSVFSPLLFACGFLLMVGRDSQADVTAQANTPLEELKIAFVSNADGDQDIYLRWLDDERPSINLMPPNDGAQDWSPAWSPDGTRIAYTSDRTGTPRIYIINQNGTGDQTLLTDSPDATEISPAWSPDGTRLVFVSDRGGVGRDLYIVEADGNNLTRLTTFQTILGDPAWSPDGAWIAFWRIEQNGEIHIYKVNVDNGTIVRLSTVGPHNGMPVWSPDGTEVYFDSDRDGTWRVWRMGADGAHPTPITTDLNGASGRASLSPDGTRLLFVSNQDQSDEIYVMNVDQTGLRRLTDNTASDFAPKWQPVLPAETAFVQQSPDLLPPPTATPGITDIAVGMSADEEAQDALTLPSTLIQYDILPWIQAGWTGAGRKIAVIDLRFGGLDAFAQTNGITINIPQDAALAGYSQNSIDNHGTQVLEIIHSIAPGAELYACRYDATLEQFRACVDWAIAMNVDIVNHSAGIPALPLDGTNEWAQIVENAFTHNILWVNAAGNFNNGALITSYTDNDRDGRFDFSAGTGSQNMLRIDLDRPYAGGVFLTWETARVTGLQGGIENFDLDVRIIDLATGEELASSQRQQRTDSQLSTSEYVEVRAPGSFGIEIFTDQTITQPIQIALFVERAAIPFASNRGSVVAPGDAEHSLTIGSVDNATGIISPFSSFGLADSNLRKPNLTAPGRFIMPDGSLFVGTSAAAPVISAAAALIWQEAGSSLFTDVLFSHFTVDRLYVDPAPQESYGEGVFHMPPPPSVNTGAGIQQTVTIDPFTVFPEAAVVVEVETPVCAGALPMRLAVEASGYVTFNLGLSMRASASQTSGQLATLQFGEEFRVIAGPECEGGLNWWQVQLNDGSTGWLAEGNNYYFLAPINLERAQVGVIAQECPLAPPTQLAIGTNAVVDQVPSGRLTYWRSEDTRFTVGFLSRGDELYVLGGPRCGGDDLNVLRWYVRASSGEWQGHEGWVSEAITGERWLIPASP